jgi:hypothetical protein
VDDARLSVVSVRGRRALIVAVATTMLGSGCLAPGPAPSGPPPTPSAEATTTTSATRRPAAGPTASVASLPSAAPDPTPLVDPTPVDVPDTALVICESWGAEPPSDEVDCRTALELAVATLGGDDAARVARFDVRYGEPCRIDGACDRRADVRTVIASAATYDTLLVRVGRDGNGDVLVWPPTHGPVIAPAAFAAPRQRAPDVGDDAPAAVRDREPLPFCGKETLATPDGYDPDARRCFLGGVAGWTAVELISAETTEDGVVTRIYRFTGRGPILQLVRSPSGWGAVTCGISPIQTPAVFVMAECGGTKPL